MSIRIKDLTVTFQNGVTAIDHADLEIPKGIYGLPGENGAGKTTLMRVLTTVLAPSGEPWLSMICCTVKEIMRRFRKKSDIFRRKSIYIQI